MGTLYSDFKMFHFPEKLASLQQDKAITSPIHIRLKPTNHCNHRCRYCAYLDPKMQLGQNMQVKDSIPKNKMLEIAHDLVDIGVKSVTYSGGGEPLMYPHLLEASKILSQGKIKLACLTNGSLLHSEIADFFSEHASWIRVSMDGYDDTSYINYRRVKDGEYTKIMHNLENFRKLNGQCVLGVSLIVDKDNNAHIYNIAKNLKDVGVQNIKISVCITSNIAAENTEYHRNHFANVQNEISKTIETLGDDNFKIHNAFHDLDDRFTKNYTSCPYMQIQSIIAADLGVYACHDKAYNLQCGLLGSLKEQSFSQFWFSNKDKFFTINPSKDCNHHCIANTKNKMLFDFINVDKEHLEFV